MKKVLSKILSSILSVAVTMSLAITSFAETTGHSPIIADGAIRNESQSSNDLVLVSENTYELNDEWSVTVLGYKDAGNSNDYISARSAGSGSDFYKYYCKFTKSAVGQTWDWLEMWVWGMFNWNTAADTVYVTNYGSEMNVLHTHATIVNDTGTVHKDNQGMTFLGGHRYGIVSRTIVMNNGSNMNQSFTLSVDVNINGDVNVSPSNATAM
ncbi:MAG: hypothetical protein ACI4JZ_09670 [Oscillospiraceae bacterium]